MCINGSLTTNIYSIGYSNTMAEVICGTKSTPPMFENTDTTKVNFMQLLIIVLFATTVPVAITLVIMFIVITIFILTRKMSKL